MTFDAKGALGGVTVVLIGIAMPPFVQAQDLQQTSQWTYGAPVELAPHGSVEFGLDGLTRQADAQRLSRAVFTGAEGLIAAQQRGAWRRQANGSLEQIRIRTHNGVSPLPEGTIERARFEAAQNEVAYIRAWPLVAGADGPVQFELTPHAGVGVSNTGGTAEAGATIRIGQLSVADGDRAYEQDQGRWYLFAAGTGTAVGMNWARGMDGWNRQLSHDSGSFIGDAQIGVAWRQGDTQTSFGYVHREITAEGVHGGSGIDRNATEGFVALQFSIRPTW